MPGLAEIIRLRTGDCRQAAAHLPQLAAGESSGIESIEGIEGIEGIEVAAGHVAGCLRCQAEVAAYRRILRHLRSLRHDLVDPPPGALAAVLATLEAAAIEQHSASAGSSWAVRAAVGGITVATAAAGAAGVLVWMSRRRVGLPAAG